jgi:hypothetical protein
MVCGAMVCGEIVCGVQSTMVCGVSCAVCSGVRCAMVVQCTMVYVVQWCVMCNGVRQHAARYSKSAIGVCDKQQEHLVDVGFLLETNLRKYLLGFLLDSGAGLCERSRLLLSPCLLPGGVSPVRDIALRTPPSVRGLRPLAGERAAVGARGAAERGARMKPGSLLHRDQNVKERPPGL